jgi:hypothetical protein
MDGNEIHIGLTVVDSELSLISYLSCATFLLNTKIKINESTTILKQPVILKLRCLKISLSKKISPPKNYTSYIT